MSDLPSKEEVSALLLTLARVNSRPETDGWLIIPGHVVREAYSTLTSLYGALEALQGEVERLNAECFKLAAGQCEASIAHEGGSMVCGVVQAATARAERAEKALRSIKEKALIAKLRKPSDTYDKGVLDGLVQAGALADAGIQTPPPPPGDDGKKEDGA